jgi:hypothetical protein
MNTTTRDAIEHLQEVGFGENEARAYATLVQRGPLTGYQLARESGIPRPNVYPVIDRLEKRGAITRIHVGGGVKYAALPAAEMLARLSRTVDAHLAGAATALSALADSTESDYVWNVEGYENMLARAVHLIGDARERILIGLWSRESAHLAAAVADAQARGVRVVTLCIEGCELECGGCRGEVYRYGATQEAAPRWLMLDVDDRQALVGQVTRSGDAKAAQTSLEVLVLMTAQYLRNAIATAEIARSLGPRLPKLLDPEATSALGGEGLAAGGQSWLGRVSALVRRAHR